VFDFNAFRNRPFNIFALASFAGFLGLYVPFFYIQQYSSSFAGVKEDLAFYTLVILNAGSVFGRVAPALIADRIGLLNTYTASTIGAAVLVFAWIACRSIGGIIAFALAYGFFAGFAAALQPAVLAALCTEANRIGTWVGMGSLLSSVGILIGNPIAGRIFHGPRGQNWLGVQLWCAVTVFVCMLATAGTRIARAGLDIRARV
jgi:predicted MFS family arabinose efflux permease